MYRLFRHSLLTTFMLAAFVALHLPVTAQADDTRISIVLDASGSMWGQINGVTKISIAQDVVSDLVTRLPASQAVGLTAYGHRRKGDCGDIETLISSRPDQQNAIVSAVRAISPKGKTPLSAAVLQAAEDLRHTEEKASVILISDGEETCNMDPCLVGQELEKSGIDFTIHVVGFDIADQKTRDHLQCMAAETGGTYRNARDGASLADAMDKVVEARPDPKPLPPQPSARLDGPEEVAAGSQLTVTWEGPNEDGDFIAIVPQGGDASTLLASEDVSLGNPLSFMATPAIGSFDLVYVRRETGKILARSPIKVLAVEASLTSPDMAKAGSLIQVAWTGPGNPGDYVCIAKLEAPLAECGFYFDVSVGPKGDLRMPSHPGDYELRYITNTDPQVIKARQTIAIEDVALTLKAASEAQASGVLNVLWKGTENPKDYIAFARPGEPLPHIVTMAEVAEGNPLAVPVPDQPGPYELRYYFAEGDRIVRKLDVDVK